MKLLIATGIYPPEIGGPAGYVKGVATELANQGHEVSVVTYGDEKTETSANYKVQTIKRCDSLPVRYLKYAYQTWKLAREADLVYAQGPVSEGLPAALASIFARKPLVLKVVGDYAWEQYQQTGTNYESARITNGFKDDPAKYELLVEFVAHRHSGKIWALEAVERWVASRAKAIIVPSQYLKSIVEKWGIEADKIKVVYNSIAPLPDTQPNPSKSPLVMGDLLNSPHDKGGEGGCTKIILTAVRAVPWKGGDFLCDVLKDLSQEYVLAVAGDGPSLEDWKKHADEIGVTNRVMWLGRLSRAELTEWYNKADLFVLATGYEGFPHVVVEAASTGLPCIVSDKGGNPEIAELFPNLVTVAEYQNKQAWVEAITVRITNLRELRIGEKSKLPEVLGFGRMVTETYEVLKFAHRLNLDRVTPKPLAKGNSQPNSQHRLNLDSLDSHDSPDYLSNITQENSIEAKSSDSQIPRFPDSHVSNRPRILSIGLEKKLFKPGKVRNRIVEQLKDFDATIIVFAKQKFDEQIAQNVRVISTNSWNKFFYITDALRIVWKLRKQKFDVITSQDPTETGLVAYLASKFLKTALAIQDHGYHFHGNYYRKESWLNQFRYFFARFLIARADAIRVVSQRTEDALVALGIAKEKIVRFPLALNTKYQIANGKSDFSMEQRGTHQWSELGDGSLDSQIPDSRFFLIVCRFVPIKRIDLAIHAFSILAKQNPDVKLKIVGQGPLESQIKQWILDFELQNRVEIIPWTDNLADLYRGAISTLITSDREGYGMTALESLACGTPVIMTDVGCAGEVVKNGENGIIVPVGDVMAMANGMEKMLSSSTQYSVHGTQYSDPSSRFQVPGSVFTSKASMTDFLLSAISQQLSAKKKKDEDFWRFSEKDMSENQQQLRLLFITQVVDKNDPILGFVIRWIKEFVNQGVKMTVLTRKMAYEDLPQGATGQDLGQPVIRRVLNLWYYSIKFRNEYDKVFVHMTPQIVDLGWPLWFILRKSVYMWYMHKSVTRWLKIALWMTKKTFTASDLSLRVDSPKKTIVGHGIDTEQFKPINAQRRPEVLWISRIQPSKKLEESLDFMAEFHKRYPNVNWKMRVIGSDEGNEEYLQAMKQEVDRLGIAERVVFEGQKNHDDLPQIFAGASVFISTSETGSIDKVVLESLACGTPVIAKGAEYHDLPGVIKLQDKENAMQTLNTFFANPQTNETARKGVVEVHDLGRLVVLLIAQL